MEARNSKVEDKKVEGSNVEEVIVRDSEDNMEVEASNDNIRRYPSRKRTNVKLFDF